MIRLCSHMRRTQAQLPALSHQQICVNKARHRTPHCKPYHRTYVSTRERADKKIDADDDSHVADYALCI